MRTAAAGSSAASAASAASARQTAARTHSRAPAELSPARSLAPSPAPQLLSNFCDNLLKKSGERLSDDALEDKLEKVVRLFCYLSDKDIFAEFYKKQ